MTKAERDRWRRAERRWTNNELADRIRGASGLIEGSARLRRPRTKRKTRARQ